MSRRKSKQGGDFASRKRPGNPHHIHSRFEQLEVSHSRLETFTRTLCHDLQAPLTAVKLQIAATQILHERGDHEAVNRRLEQLDRAADGMASLIDSMLQFSQADQGSLHFVETDLAAVAGDAMQTLRYKLQSTEAIVDIGPLPKLVADPILLRQVFQNLIDNALKYRAERPLRITIQSIPSNMEATIEVRDNGRGFHDPDNVMMEPFQRIHHDVQGHGIGLSTCHRIMERHGGAIRAEGVPDVGAKFFLDFPLNGPPAT